MEIIIIIVIMLIVFAVHLHRLGLAREADEKWQAEDKLDRDEEWEAMGVWAREHPYRPRLESLRVGYNKKGKKVKA